MSDHSDEEQASLLPKQDSSSSATAQNKRTLFVQWAIAAIDGADGTLFQNVSTLEKFKKKVCGFSGPFMASPEP